MHLTKTEPDANLHRFYRLEIVRGLLGNWGIMSNWSGSEEPDSYSFNLIFNALW